MRPPDSEILRKVIEWLEFGDEDLRLARHGLTLTSGVPYRLIAYHAQQCAEKYLKAFLVTTELIFLTPTISEGYWNYVPRRENGLKIFPKQMS